MNRVLSFQRVIDSDHPGEEQLDAGERTQSGETAHPRTARSPRDRDCRCFGLQQNAADPPCSAITSATWRLLAVAGTGFTVKPMVFQYLSASLLVKPMVFQQFRWLGL